jgi:hypothetical protein
MSLAVGFLTYDFQTTNMWVYSIALISQFKNRDFIGM